MRGTVMLPDTNRSSDWFVRASFYIHAIPKTASSAEAMAGAFSMIRNVSVPLGISTPGSPTFHPRSGARCRITKTGAWLRR